MGTSESKSVINGKDNILEEKLPSTPIQAAQFRRLDIDPRSPSSDIARTPIEVLKTPLVTSTMHSGDNSLNITNDDTNPCINLDPRSPTIEFHRTPIITEAVLKLQSMSLHNKNLDNARMPVVAVTPAKPKKIPETVSRRICCTPDVDTVKGTSPKLLESSPVIIIKSPENKRNSVVGLLETNIDFIETDLDAVIRNKALRSQRLSTDDISQNLSAEETVEVFPIITEETTSEIITDDREIACETEETIDYDQQAIDPQVFEAIVEEIEETFEETTKIPDVVADASMLSVDELDKKLTNLIYEDKQAIVSPKLNKFTSGHRTPLGDRNSNSQQQRKSIPILKVSDKPTKPLGNISRIPVFKEKKIKGKANVQCENTPPRMQSKRSQWSAEDSMII